MLIVAELTVVGICWLLEVSLTEVIALKVLPY